MADKLSRESIGNRTETAGGYCLVHREEYYGTTRCPKYKSEGGPATISPVGVDFEGIAKTSGNPIGELTVKVDVDVSEALKGLKAVQREAKKAAQALKELGELAQSNVVCAPVINVSGVVDPQVLHDAVRRIKASY